MNSSQGSAVIGTDLVVKGDLRSNGRIEVHGYVEGKVTCDHLLIHPGGRVLGTIDAGNADVHGSFQGRARVRNVISIGSTGKVSGDVRYGGIALTDGGELSADVRNVPPELSGDFHVVVRRGRSVALTPADITAFDPDNTAEELTYRVTALSQGHIARVAATATAIDSFTQAELQTGEIVFVHDGTTAGSGGFDVRVVDRSGGESGPPQKVTVAVI